VSVENTWNIATQLKANFGNLASQIEFYDLMKEGHLANAACMRLMRFICTTDYGHYSDINIGEIVGYLELEDISMG